MKKIVQYKNGFPIKTWRSVSEIQKKKGYLKSHISECLNGKRKSAYRCEWQYQVKKRGVLKYWFKSKNDMIKDVTFLCDQCDIKDKQIKELQERIYNAIGIVQLCNTKCAKETIAILRGEDYES